MNGLICFQRGRIPKSFAQHCKIGWPRLYSNSCNGKSSQSLGFIQRAPAPTHFRRSVALCSLAYPLSSCHVHPMFSWAHTIALGPKIPVGDQRYLHTGGSGGKKLPPATQLQQSREAVKLALGGNLVITCAKFASWWYSGSAAMLSEAIHSFVDSGNQALLLVGIQSAMLQPDKAHQYGYGRAIYFWSLVSALGTFWLGAGVSLRNSLEHLLYPSLDPLVVSWDVWAVLGASFAIDGYVLFNSMRLLNQQRRPGTGLVQHLKNVRDPTQLAIVCEDGAACLGVIMAVAGIGATHITGAPVYDAVASVGISFLLAGMGIFLARLNEHYLLGKAVDPDITQGIKKLLLERPAITDVFSIQSQWISPYTFAFKAEVDFDGTYLAAKLHSRYEDEFLKSIQGGDAENNLKVLLSWYAEDVMRVVEKEVRELEIDVRKQYPEAAFIEIEPDSQDAQMSAIESSYNKGTQREVMWQVERETFNQFRLDIENQTKDKVPKDPN